MNVFFRGMTLIELLFSVTILAFCLAGISLTYVNMFVMSDISRDYTLATNAVQAKVEQIKKEAFDNITASNPAVAGFFNLTDYGFPSNQSQGYVEIVPSFGNYTNSLTRIRAVACFQTRKKLIGNSIANCTTSPVEAITLVTR